MIFSFSTLICSDMSKWEEEEDSIPPWNCASFRNDPLSTAEDDNCCIKKALSSWTSARRTQSGGRRRRPFAKSVDIIKEGEEEEMSVNGCEETAGYELELH